MSGYQCVRHQLTEQGQLVKHARLPCGVEDRRVVLDSVLVRVERHRVAVDVLVQPRLVGEHVVEEHSVERQVRVDDELGGEAGLVLRHLGLGQVQAVRTGPTPSMR